MVYNSNDNNIISQLRCQISGLFDDKQLLDENQPSGFSEKSDAFLSTVAILLNRVLDHLQNNGGNHLFGAIAFWGNEVLAKLDSIDKKLGNIQGLPDNIGDVQDAIKDFTKSVESMWEEAKETLDAENLANVAKEFASISKSLYSTANSIRYMMKAQDPTVRLKATVNDDGNGGKDDKQIPGKRSSQRKTSISKRLQQLKEMEKD